LIVGPSTKHRQNTATRETRYMILGVFAFILMAVGLSWFGFVMGDLGWFGWFEELMRFASIWWFFLTSSL
jgi:hypothetical protein